MSEAKIFSFINYKGGVANTTSAYHIGCCLAGAKSKKVLLIDIDPQTNLTFLCASIDAWKKRRKRTIATMYGRYMDKKPIETRKYLWNTPIRLSYGQRHPNIDLIPCDMGLIGEDIGGGRIAGAYPGMKMLKKNAKRFMRDRTFLTKVIEEVADDYDYVLIDCPPNLYSMTQNALLASDHYIITAIPDHLSTMGLNIFIDKVNKIGKLAGAAAKFAGKKTDNYHMADFGAVLFVRVQGRDQNITVTHRNKMQEIRATFPDKCFETHITELIGYTQAAENSRPVWRQFGKNARLVVKHQEYPKVVDELLKKFQ